MARCGFTHTRAPGDATRYLRGLADQGECVVAAGGDGTTNDVINGLNPGVALALFPSRHRQCAVPELSIPRRPEDAAKVVLDGRTLNVTPARLNGRRFMVMAGIGYDAWVVDQVDLILKRRVGKLAYVISMIRQLFRYGQVQYRITVDGRPLDCFSAVITNGRYYGGSFGAQPRGGARQAQPAGVDVPASGPGLSAALPGGAGGGAHGARRRRRLAERRESHRHRPGLEPVQADGDPVGWLPAEIELEPAPVRLRVPWA